MVKFGKEITVNLGNYQSMKISVGEATTFEECDFLLAGEIQRLNIVNFQHAGVKL
jgi:hypothetical protein